MAPKRKSKLTSPLQCRPRVRVWLEHEGENVFCSGLCRLLQAVEAAGSIKDAAPQTGKSYRSVWNRIKEAEKKLGQQLVVAQVGGHGSRRSSLTPFAKGMIEQFLSLRAELNQLAGTHVEQMPLVASAVKPSKKLAR